MKTKARQETALQIGTTFRCLCRSRLVLKELKETKGVALFGCERCQCYVVVTKNRIKEYIYLSNFNWKRMMADLYKAYLEAHRYICFR
jgi:hypothetical protein